MIVLPIAKTLALASPLLRANPQLHRSPALSMYNGGGYRGDGYRGDGFGGGGGGYRGETDGGFGGPSLDFERTESVKACAITGIVGTAVASPLLITILAKSGSAPLQFGLMAVSAALFGAVYRCVVRGDDNGQLRLGAVAAFAIVRALATVPGSASWTSSVQMDLLLQLWIGVAAFGHAAFAYESAVDNGFAFPLEGHAPALGAPRYGFGRGGGLGGRPGGYGNGYGDGPYGGNYPGPYGNNQGQGGSYGTQDEFYSNNRGTFGGPNSYVNDVDRPRLGGDTY